ncbi:MAG: cyclic nucleotide-binding domain-containing protein [Deltaproteobacteria bacterium]|nr:cyclic nucleotide-binding domain-containing protein [Deltaproteobacteria bacterium]
MKVGKDYYKDNSELIDKLKQIPALEAFSDSDLQELLQMAKLWEFEPGELILKEGSHDKWIFYLVSGKAKIIKNGKELVTLRRIGDVFGEMGIIGGTVRSASVQAIEKTICLATDISVIDQMPKEKRSDIKYIIFRGFAEILANRLRETTDELIKCCEEVERLKKKLGQV